jgi:hypothetical protein
MEDPAATSFAEKSQGGGNLSIAGRSIDYCGHAFNPTLLGELFEHR